MNYVTYNPETLELTGYFTGQFPSEGENFFELNSELTASWTTYKMNATLDGLEVAPIVAPTPPARHITKLAFRNRFTADEKVLIELAGIDNPSSSLQERQKAAKVRVVQADLAAASYIGLDRQETRAGVLMLEESQILAEGRALEILDAEILPIERYVG